MLTRSNCTRLLADVGRGEGLISAFTYVRPVAVFAFTHPDGGNRRGVCCDHIAGYQRNWILSELNQRISRFRKNPDLTSLLVGGYSIYMMKQ